MEGTYRCWRLAVLMNVLAHSLIASTSVMAQNTVNKHTVAEACNAGLDPVLSHFLDTDLRVLPSIQIACAGFVTGWKYYVNQAAPANQEVYADIWKPVMYNSSTRPSLWGSSKDYELVASTRLTNLTQGSISEQWMTEEKVVAVESGYVIGIHYKVLGHAAVVSSTRSLSSAPGYRVAAGHDSLSPTMKLSELNASSLNVYGDDRVNVSLQALLTVMPLCGTGFDIRDKGPSESGLMLVFPTQKFTCPGKVVKLEYFVNVPFTVLSTPADAFVDIWMPTSDTHTVHHTRYVAYELVKTIKLSNVTNKGSKYQNLKPEEMVLVDSGYVIGVHYSILNTKGLLSQTSTSSLLTYSSIAIDTNLHIGIRTNNISDMAHMSYNTNFDVSLQAFVEAGDLCPIGPKAEDKHTMSLDAVIMYQTPINCSGRLAYWTYYVDKVVPLEQEVFVDVWRPNGIKEWSPKNIKEYAVYKLIWTSRVDNLTENQINYHYISAADRIVVQIGDVIGFHQKTSGGVSVLTSSNPDFSSLTYKISTGGELLHTGHTTDELDVAFDFHADVSLKLWIDGNPSLARPTSMAAVTQMRHSWTNSQPQTYAHPKTNSSEPGQVSTATLYGTIGGSIGALLVIALGVIIFVVLRRRHRSQDYMKAHFVSLADADNVD